MEESNELYADLVWDYDEERKNHFRENLAPIVLFTYNRLEHTKKTIEALKKNIYAEKSDLFIYSDASQSEASALSVKLMREYLYTVDGFKKVTIIEREENWGLAKNIMDGVTSIVNEYGKIIVLEDDIVTSKYFLKYMNDALEVYKDDDKVMNVSGYAYPISTDLLEESYFLPIGSSWGWATWKRSWELFSRAPEVLVKSYNKKMIKSFNMDNTHNYWSQVEANYNGTLYTWAIFAYETMFRNKGICLFPSQSLVQNIGFDGSGTNCKNETIYDTVLKEKPIDKFPLKLVVSERAIKRIKQYYKGFRLGIFQRVKNKIFRMIR